MDKLQRHRLVLRGAATRLLTTTREMLENREPAASVFVVAIDDPEENDATLNGLNAMIVGHLNSKEFRKKSKVR